jgi:hypothetical protein
MRAYTKYTLSVYGIDMACPLEKLGLRAQNAYCALNTGSLRNSPLFGMKDAKGKLLHD